MLHGIPNRVVMTVPWLKVEQAEALAEAAVKIARRYSPKLTIASSASFSPLFGSGWFGIGFEHAYVWFQERGIRPYTMSHVAGKVIPMWINDPHGEEQAKNPKLRTRRTADGRTQVLIFRRAARMGQRRNKRLPDGRQITVPASYPGAPGRIAVNRSRGLLRQGDVAPGVGNPGWIAKGNVGVRWRHPGLQPGRFLARGVVEAAQSFQIPVGAVTYRTGMAGDPYMPVVFGA